MTARVIWCLGMYASASTWLFNVVRQLHEAADRGPLQSHFISENQLVSSLETPGVTHLVKSHEIADERSLLRLAGQAEKIIVTWRDPRDAVTSLMRSHGHSFERALPFIEASAALCKGFLKDRRSLSLRYETGFFDDPATLTRLAGHLGYSPAAPALDTIFQASRRAAIEEYIAGLPSLPGVLQDPVSGDRLDPVTHWHSHHARRDGEIGRWQRLLTPAQNNLIRTRLPDPFLYPETAS